ncbi:MAG: hypothetical protein M1832_000532 [Thelocarpon impressellum]|nr:MAG: hypothetical protein M1832_000532 [Thelocarpon impressellum]
MAPPSTPPAGPVDAIAAKLEADPLADIPPLATSVSTDRATTTDALRLVADSIAQQRQIAARATIFHPATLAAYGLLVATIWHFQYHESSDIPLLLCTCAGATMAALVAVRAATGPYLSKAEEMSFSFLRSSGDAPEEDIVLVTSFGETVIGTLVIRLQPPSPSQENGSAEFRAWTVHRPYRGKGVGRALLAEGVRLSRDRLGEDVDLAFSDTHANNYRVLPETFNTDFDRAEQRAWKCLEGILKEA